MGCTPMTSGGPRHEKHLSAYTCPPRTQRSPAAPAVDAGAVQRAPARCCAPPSPADRSRRACRPPPPLPGHQHERHRLYGAQGVRWWCVLERWEPSTSLALARRSLAPSGARGWRVVDRRTTSLALGTSTRQRCSPPRPTRLLSSTSSPWCLGTCWCRPSASPRALPTSAARRWPTCGSWPRCAARAHAWPQAWLARTAQHARHLRQQARPPPPAAAAARGRRHRAALWRCQPHARDPGRPCGRADGAPRARPHPAAVSDAEQPASCAVPLLCTLSAHAVWPLPLAPPAAPLQQAWRF